MAEMLKLHITCRSLPPMPAATEFGLQDKERVLHEGEIMPDGSMVFRCEVKIAEKDDKLRLTGDFVHGSSAERILYLGLRPLGGADDAWIRRWKISLTGITPAMARRAVELDAPLACTIDATNAARAHLMAEGWVILMP